MAQIMGRPYLYHLLAPRIHQHIPHRTLDVLERRFHALIHKQLNTDIVEGRCMRLPQLSVLTEMVDPEMHVYTYAKASKSTPLVSGHTRALSSCRKNVLSDLGIHGAP